jgi:hypothetical protein
MNSMQCPNCGAENEFEGAAFCRSCREPLNTEADESRGDSEEARQGTDLNLQVPLDTNQQHPIRCEPSNTGPLDIEADPIDTKQESASTPEKPPESDRQHAAQLKPQNTGPVESKSGSEEAKPETVSYQENPPEPSQQQPALFGASDAGPAESKVDADEGRPEPISNHEIPPELNRQQPAQFGPLNAGPVESKSGSEEAKQEPVSNQDKPPDPDQQDPNEDEPLKLSDPIDFMINEVPDDSSYYAGGSDKETFGGMSDDRSADSREDEFRLSISGGAVGSSVKLEEAINKAIAEMNLPINDFEQKKVPDDPEVESNQKLPQEPPKRPEKEHESGSDSSDQGGPKPTAVDGTTGIYSETSQPTQENQHKVPETVPEARPEETAQAPSEQTRNQEPPQATRVEVHAEVGRQEAPPEPHESQPSAVATIVEAREQNPAARGKYPHQETPPTEKLSPAEKWNSVLSIKPKPSPAGSAEAKDLPRVSQSKGLILLSGNNLILTGGKKVLSGEEVRIGDQLYEVRIKPEDKKRKLIIGAAAAAAFLIILLAIFAGGGNGRLVGILVDNHGNYPLGEQTVRIAELNKTVQTNLAGFFTFDDLSPGLYTLQYLRGGTAVSEVRIAILKGDLTTVTLHSEESEGRTPSR